MCPDLLGKVLAISLNIKLNKVRENNLLQGSTLGIPKKLSSYIKLPNRVNWKEPSKVSLHSCYDKISHKPSRKLSENKNDPQYITKQVRC